MFYFHRTASTWIKTPDWDENLDAKWSIIIKFFSHISLHIYVSLIGWHRLVVIVSPEGDLEFRWDSEMFWCFIYVTIKLVSGTTQRSVIESCITHVSSSPRATVLREICFLVDLDRREKMLRVCLLDSRCVFLSFSYPTAPLFPTQALPKRNTHFLRTHKMKTHTHYHSLETHGTNVYVRFLEILEMNTHIHSLETHGMNNHIHSLDTR